MGWLSGLKSNFFLIFLIFTCCIKVEEVQSINKPRYLDLYGCDIISPLEYECCASINLINAPLSAYCLDIQVVPNELTLNIELNADGESFYNGKLDPSIAPICLPGSPLCLAVNHVNIALSEICTKLSIGPITLVKFPCVGIMGGQIFVDANVSSR